MEEIETAGGSGYVIGTIFILLNIITLIIIAIFVIKLYIKAMKFMQKYIDNNKNGKNN
jgi:hypothetical protein